MYKSFFGFKDAPFKLTPDPDFLFLSKVHKKALTYLNYGLNSDTGGFILVTGEVGTGKTTLIRSVMKKNQEDIVFSRVNNTRLTSEELLSMINDDFGLSIKGKDKPQLLRDLTDFLIEQFSSKKKSVLIIDEAQNLSPEHLEEIRLISNLETDKYKLLQIILVGQPELRKILAKPELRAFRQRTNVSCHICPLTVEETEQYIYHRLNVAGNRDAVIFENGSIPLIYKFSRGIPRLINVACDFLLLSAFAEQTKEISLKMVKEVMSDLEKENMYWQSEQPENNDQNTDETRACKKNDDFHLDYVKKMDILKKVSETEKELSLTKHRLKAELENEYSSMDARFDKMVKELNLIRLQLAAKQNT